MKKKNFVGVGILLLAALIIYVIQAGILNKDNNLAIKEEIAAEVGLSKVQSIKKDTAAKTYQQADSKYFSVINWYGVDDNQSYSNLFSSDDSLERLKALNRELKMNFDYYELHTQFVCYNGYYEGDKKFNYSYDKGFDTTNQHGVDFDGNEIIVTGLETVMLGKSYFTIYDNCIETGRNFSEDDFTVNDAEKEINVVLGYEYLGIHNVGDILPLSLHQKKINYKVIGFYKQNTAIKHRSEDIVFDQAIITPLYDINYEPMDKNEDSYQKIYYTQKNAGSIKITEPENEIDDNVRRMYTEKVEELGHKFDLLYTLAYSYKDIEFLKGDSIN